MPSEKDLAPLVEGGIHIFDSIWNWPSAGEIPRWILLILIVLAVAAFAFTMLLGAISKLIDVIFKLVEAYKSSGLPVLLSKVNKAKVRKRSQFCTVLAADLNYIAKAESWNDQYFTDLEAEVETEGGYYASSVHKLIGRRSHGLRKERSLIRAIATSTERAIQLVGEPGAGKSVALRHLASQLAAKGIRSKGKHAIVPLYVNMREMESSTPEHVNADSIRDFILDNIRRGDSDTSAFVRENWDEYRDKGVWFFLFDSFDEIPAVLHAEKGSAAAAAYSMGIRQFIEGMGACKGVLASREFKGPEALPWKKFRILPLHSDKQHELIRNAFLNPDQERVALHHLAQPGGTLGTTPLFLTLLCKYVKSENRAPINDYDLLSLHIDRLARRDPHYLERKYGLTPDNLLAGAERLAQLFAEEATLGLAPTSEQIEKMAPASGIPAGEVSQLLSALVDCKIGRSDVPNAAHGDRRFAFSHRRYQEALFVRFLVSNPGHLSAMELLTDPRWREYAVTLLQTEPTATIEAILGSASEILSNAAMDQKIQPAKTPISAGCGYFEWHSQISTYVLELLQEGMARRMESVPPILSQAVQKLLQPRWRSGDSFDRSEVVRLGALLPQATLIKYLAVTFRSGTQKNEVNAFQQTAALLGGAPKIIREAVLKRLSAETLAARDRGTLIRLEALAARLPKAFGASLVFQRNASLRKAFHAITFVTRLIYPDRLLRTFDSTTRLVLPLARTQRTPPSNSVFLLGVTLAGLFFAALTSNVKRLSAGNSTEYSGKFILTNDLSSYITWWQVTPLFDMWPVLLTACLMIPYSVFCTLYVLRTRGERLNFSFYFSRLTSLDVLSRYLIPVVAVAGVFSLMLGAIYLLGFGVAWVGEATDLFHWKEPRLLIGMLTIAPLTIVALVLTAVAGVHKDRRLVKEFQIAKATGKNDLVVLGNLGSIDSVMYFLTQEKTLLSDYSENRSFASFLQKLPRANSNPNFPAFRDYTTNDRHTMRKCLQLLEDRLPNLAEVDNPSPHQRAAYA